MIEHILISHSIISNSVFAIWSLATSNSGLRLIWPRSHLNSRMIRIFGTLISFQGSRTSELIRVVFFSPTRLFIRLFRYRIVYLSWLQRIVHNGWSTVAIYCVDTSITQRITKSQFVDNLFFKTFIRHGSTVSLSRWLEPPNVSEKFHTVPQLPLKT